MAGKNTISITFRLDGDGKGFKALAENADGLKKAMTSAIVEGGKLKASLTNWSHAVQALESVSNALDKVNGAFQSVTEESKNFDKAMKTANTMAGKGSADFEKLRGQVSELSKEVPVARDALAQGLYQVISNGVPEDNWISFLEKSAKSSIGGITDLGEAVKVTSTMIKNYGLEWDAAGAIQDKIQMTAKNGVTSFEQLAQALPRVAANASTLGVSIDELFASFATLTGVSGNTAEVSTQLGAVFTALVKPSSEAADMASKMGIQFNAAAIQAAGGFQNFLAQLSVAVTQYAAANGVLEQEVMAKLFGSAESLRALTPLMGNLAGKFAENIDAISDSAGTIEAAYADMASTSEAKSQQMSNNIAAVTDKLTVFASEMSGVVDIASKVGMAALGVATLAKSYKELNIVMTINAAKSKAVAASMTLLGLRTKSTAAITRVFNAAMTTGAYKAVALKIALRGLLIATGIGAAFAALGAAIEYFSISATKGAEGTRQLSEAEQAGQQAAAEAKVGIDSEIKALSELIKSKKDARAAVNRLNEVYGESFGTYDTAAKWYDALCSKSKSYIKQIGYEAQAKTIAMKLAEKEIALEANFERRRELWRKGEAVKRTLEARGSQAYYVERDTTAYAGLKNEGGSLVKEVNELKEQQAAVSRLMAGNKTAQPVQRKTASPAAASTREAADRIEELSAKIRAAKKEYLSAGDAQKEVIQRNIGLWKDEVYNIELAQLAASRPTELNTIRDINAELEYQRKLRENATQENIAQIDARIAELEKVKTVESSVAEDISAVPDSAINSVDMLGRKMQYYQEQLSLATSDEQRSVINGHIAQLKAMNDAWGLSLRKPADVSKLNTIKELDEAIDYYRELQNTQSAEEIGNIEATVIALEKKKQALMQGARIANMKSDMGNMLALPNKELKAQVSGIGFDGLTSKISELKRELQTLEMNPNGNEKQKQDLMEMISVYENWQKKSVLSIDTVKAAWSGIQGVGDGINSITAAIEGNGNAWEKISAAVNGFFAVLQGIQSIVGVIGMVQTVMAGGAAAAGGVAAATGSSAAATATDTAAKVANTTATVPMIAANKAATASYLELAAAQYMAAHASIPFAGYGIGAGFVAAAKTLVTSIGVIPFANGGVVSGPTLALVGEYSGAKNNPEVIAPLDKLRTLIRDDHGPGRVRFEIEGRTLVGILSKENNIRRRM